jgi:hypothetical protein
VGKRKTDPGSAAIQRKRRGKPRGSPKGIESHRWPKGRSGNPAGRPPAGLSIKEWWNQMQDWPLAKLTEAIEDPAAPAAKVAAARAWRDACSSGFTSGGAPVAGADLNRIIDYTAGKAQQSVDVTSGGQPIELVDRPSWEKV